MSIGQVNVKVQGKVEKGDYILAADGNAGRAVRPERIASFAEYKRVVGTAWESKENSMTPEASDGSGTGKVLAAVGVK